MALPPVCAGGLFHYALLISLAVLQTVLNVSCSGRPDSVSIMRVEVAAVNQELMLSVNEGKGRWASLAQVAIAGRRTQVEELRQAASHLRIPHKRYWRLREKLMRDLIQKMEGVVT